MPRYIDADDFYKRLSNPPYTIYNGDMFAEWFEECFKTQPTADVEPVRHGRWIRGVSKGFPENPTCLWYCSCCGEKIRYNDTLRTYQKLKKPVNEVNPRCRKCGAKMDGDAE